VPLTNQCFICKFLLTGERDSPNPVQEPTLTHETEPLTREEELLTTLTAVANPLRLRIIAELAEGRVHVSELARRLGISRPLLYMHLDRLEKAGIVTGHLELSEDGKAMKYFELAPFELRLTAEVITEALRDGGQDGQHIEEKRDSQMKETDT
jgi:DNA-binding transcriptional ArsR family regulator